MAVNGTARHCMSDIVTQPPTSPLPLFASSQQHVVADTRLFGTISQE